MTREVEPTSNNPYKVLIVGSGAAGLLTAIYMLRRNKLNSQKQAQYEVILIDREDDYTKALFGNKFDKERKEESVMIGLTAYAVEALKTFPYLYEDYISRMPIERKKSTVGKCFEGLLGLSNLSQEERAKSGFMVDRKMMCVALAKYLKDMYIDDKFPGDSPKKSNGKSEFLPYYNTKAVFVNEDYKYVMIQKMLDNGKKEDPDGFQTIEYDLLLGCDGENAFVRTMMEDIHDSFKFSLVEKVGIARTITLDHPKNTEGSFMTFIKNMPNVTTAIFPDEEEGGDRLHLTCGYENDKPCDEELESDDAEIVSKYFEDNFKSFPLHWNEVGTKWVQQKRFTTGMLCCNYYHSKKMSALLLGDEASMTIPNIGTGNGINRTLIDIRMFDVYLNKHEDDFEKALPAYSSARNRQVSPLKDWFASL